MQPYASSRIILADQRAEAHFELRRLVRSQHDRVVRDTARRVVDDTPEPDLDLAAEPKRIPAFVIWGLERVNVAFRAESLGSPLSSSDEQSQSLMPAGTQCPDVPAE